MGRKDEKLIEHSIQPSSFLSRFYHVSKHSSIQSQFGSLWLTVSNPAYIHLLTTSLEKKKLLKCLSVFFGRVVKVCVVHLKVCITTDYSRGVKEFSSYPFWNHGSFSRSAKRRKWLGCNQYRLTGLLILEFM